MTASAGIDDRSKEYSTTPTVLFPLEYILDVLVPFSADFPIQFDAADVEFICDASKLAGYASRLPPAFA